MEYPDRIKFKRNDYRWPFNFSYIFHKTDEINGFPVYVSESNRHHLMFKQKELTIRHDHQLNRKYWGLYFDGNYGFLGIPFIQGEELIGKWSFGKVKAL